VSRILSRSAWPSGRSSPISSRNRTPRSAARNSPAASVKAPVNEPFTWPKSLASASSPPDGGRVVDVAGRDVRDPAARRARLGGCRRRPCAPTRVAAAEGPGQGRKRRGHYLDRLRPPETRQRGGRNRNIRVPDLVAIARHDDAESGREGLR